MPGARVVDWSLAVVVGIAFASGIISLVSGRPEQWWVFIVHGLVGFWLLPLLAWKLWRVWPRLLRPRAWNRGTLLGLLATLLSGVVLLSGIGWSSGVSLVLANYNLLNWHILAGLLLTLIVSWHMFVRARPLRQRDLPERRRLLRMSGWLALAAALWPVQQVAAHRLDWPGSRRRFTGSREIGSYAGQQFPIVSWVADWPAPIAVDQWQLTVGGAVARPLRLSYAELLAAADQLEATLDCTGGFYTTQHWRGLSVDRLLEQARPMASAQRVSFVSVTGYRWSLPLAEARDALLATHCAGELLQHGHGAPLRLVAAGRRGFEWVKWLVRIEVLEGPDPGELLAIYTSSLFKQA